MRWLPLILLFSLSPLNGSEPETDHLALAAEHLGRGESSQAMAHLAVHLKSHPDDLMTRAYLAELLFQEKRTTEAAAEFEAFIAAAQPMNGKPHDHLLHCHTRLMNIAEEAGDEYREHLHRGIGLWQLVQRWDRDPSRRDERAAETTLIQAMNELKEAERKRPNDPRVQLYLAEVSLRLGQPTAARTALRQAKALPPLGLTPAERQRLAAIGD